MNPYYDADGVTIYHADCRDVLEQLVADVMVTDPPFGVGIRAKQARNKGGGSHAVAPASVLYDDDPDEVRVMLESVMPLALSWVDRAMVFSGTRMLYAYPEPDGIGAIYLPAGSGYTPWGFQTSQPVLYYGADPYLADGRGNRPNGLYWTNHRDEAGRLNHPCPKPLRWMTWAVERCSRPGETVLDPFMGTGTTLVAARSMGRRAIGVELVEHYCEIAVSRLAQLALPLEYEPLAEQLTMPAS